MSIIMEKPETREESETMYGSSGVGDSQSAAASSGGSRRWRGRLLGVAALLGVALIALLPQILSTATMRQQIATSLMQDFDGKVEIGGANLSWWSPGELSSMTMRDHEGETMATIASAKVSSSLWQMFWPGIKPLEVTINQPVVVYEVDAYGRTNWEKVMTAFNSRSGSSGWPAFRHQGQPLHIVIRDGRVVLKDRVSNRTIEAIDIQAKVQKSPKLLEGTLAGQTRLLTGQGSELPAGDLSARFQLAMAGEAVIAGDVEGNVRKTPLELIRPWLKQAVPHLDLRAGTTDGTFQTKWTGDFRSGLKLAANGTLSASNVQVRSSQWAAGHELTGQELAGEFSIDNTLPTAPGTFDIHWQLSDSQIQSLRDDERQQLEEQLEAPLPASPLAQPLALGLLELTTTGTLDVVNQRLQFQQANVDSELIRLELEGSISRFGTGRPEFDLQGTSSGDLLPFVMLARPDLQRTTTGKGLAAEEFAIRGRFPAPVPASSTGPAEGAADVREEAPVPGAPVVGTSDFGTPDSAPEKPATDAAEPIEAELAATADEPFSAAARWSWDVLEAYGVKSENGSLWTRFEDQKLKIVPVDMPIGPRGQFVGQATIDFTDGERILVVERGYVLKDVEFTAQMCRTWLKYVAPVFAEATDLEGEFSLFMNPARINLKTGLAEELAGVLQIERCRLGPGPAILEMTAPIRGLGQLGKRPGGGPLQEGAKWMELPSQEVPFTKHEGRVYHKQLTFQSGPVLVVSEGSVGDDQTLDLAITIPLAAIAPDRPIVARLLNTPLQLHVGGTFDKPEVDASQIANVGKQIGTNAVEGLIQGLMNRNRGR